MTDRSGVTQASGLQPLLAALSEAAAALAATDLGSVEVTELAAAHDTLRGVGDRLGAVRARLAARIADDGRWAASGTARTFPEWVARRGGSSVGTARRELALGRALESEVPAAGREVAAGRISLEHAQVLSEVAATSDARRAALASDRPDRNEAFLVGAARRLGVDDFRRLAKKWAAAVDQAAHEAEHRAAIEREHLRLVRRRDGVDIQGFLAAENAEILATALRTAAGVPAADDRRTPEQRAAAALTGLAQAVLDHGLEGGGTALVRPHLLVHVPYETYAALAGDGDGPQDATGALEAADGSLGEPAELDDGTPLAPSAFARIACDARITRVVFGPAGQPLDVGRAQRTFTGPQRAAVVARDRTCRYPGCSAPPMICEVHHIIWWSRDGLTEVSNGILLCAFHHRQVHQRDVAISHDGAGGFTFARRDGSRIGGEAPRGGEASRVGGEGGPPGGRAGPDQGAFELDACA
ncbi:HNH endonuclease signature motif containing protein [Actinotalea fermentans]|uniref:HNH nuclease domain-containing protein n=1 Tax=Actinotalea fermentans TaxID=43671 RepID=A0A511Z0F9_9CELL|nr:HNH endonuclease signature motif containing protein [Actinotalea fermentans]GEN80944.1 hypothetical protein AFE02nite_26780 [Actinotalea fermentans]